MQSFEEKSEPNTVEVHMAWESNTLQWSCFCFSDSEKIRASNKSDKDKNFSLGAELFLSTKLQLAADHFVVYLFISLTLQMRNI